MTKENWERVESGRVVERVIELTDVGGVSFRFKLVANARGNTTLRIDNQEGRNLAVFDEDNAAALTEAILTF
jgi:hypothetical protein